MQVIYYPRIAEVGLMLSKGHTLEEVSAWLGHKNIKTTWEKYKGRLQLTYRKVGNE